LKFSVIGDSNAPMLPSLVKANDGWNRKEMASATMLAMEIFLTAVIKKCSSVRRRASVPDGHYAINAIWRNNLRTQ
jgi:hypothetical protein